MRGTLVVIAVALGCGGSASSPASQAPDSPIPPLLARVGPAPRVFANLSLVDAAIREQLVAAEQSQRAQHDKSAGDCGVTPANLQRLRIAIGEPLHVAAEIDGKIDARGAACLLGPSDPAALARTGVIVRDRPGGVAIEYLAVAPPAGGPAANARELSRRCEGTSCAAAMLGPSSARLWMQLAVGKTLHVQLTGANFHRFVEAANQLLDDIRRTSRDVALLTIREQPGGMSLEMPTDASVVSSTLLALGLRVRLIESFKIPSSSMVPSVLVDDHILVGKGRLLGDPVPGDLLVYKQGDGVWIKRYIAGPGQTIAETRAGLEIDGKPLATEVVDPSYHFRDGEDAEHAVERTGTVVREHLGSRSYLTLRTGPPHTEGTWKVPPDHVFFIGDNRNNSNDSRYIGPSARDAIVGRVLCTWFALRDGTPDWDRIGIALE